MRRIRLGLIGAGIIVHNRHLPAIESLPECYEIVAVCSRTEKNANALAERIGRPAVYTDYRQLLARSDVEAVDVAVPIYLNFEITRAAAEAGKHVMCEKPIATNLADAVEMVKLHDRYGIVLLIAENFRYASDIVQMRQWVRSGMIGKPILAQWNSINAFNPAGPYVQTSWRQKPAHPGGFITDAGVHYIDALRSILGEVDQVQAFMSWTYPLLGSYDTAVINLRMRGDILAQLTMSWASTEAVNEGLRIFGTEGTVVSRKGETSLSRPGKATEFHAETTSAGFREELEDFHAAITEGKTLDMTPEEALRDLAVLLAALQSAERRETVDFPRYLAQAWS